MSKGKDSGQSDRQPSPRTYARSLKGKRAYGIRPYHRGKNVTLITVPHPCENRYKSRKA